jgi:hypothetical protein
VYTCSLQGSKGHGAATGLSIAALVELGPVAAHSKLQSVLTVPGSGALDQMNSSFNKEEIKV